jgi:hypothetical protein
MNVIHDDAALATPHLPLARIVLCLDCDTCFEIGSDACPACGGRAWASVARFLDRDPSRGRRPPLDFDTTNACALTADPASGGRAR